MFEQRGVVLHIAQGSFEGTIAWQKNPAAEVSSHFVVGEDGAIAQVVDTDITAWTQAAGNGHWMSIENAGFSGNPLTAAQVESCARLYARGVTDYGWPLQATDSTSGRGLGWHGMGGNAWGGHPDCPGQPIINQRGAILARATQLLNQPTEDNVAFIIREPDTGSVWVADYVSRRWVSTQEEWDLLRAQGVPDKGDMPAGQSIEWYGHRIDVPAPAGGGLTNHQHNLSLTGRTGDVVS